MSFSAAADDQFKFREMYKLYTLSKKTTQSVTIKLEYTMETTDICNEKSFIGEFEKVLVGKSENTMGNLIWTGSNTQKYIANFSFGQTLMACNNKEKKVFNFESKTLTLKPIDGYLSVEILVPYDYQLVISKYE
jgi:hypothetical protein